MGVTAKPFGKFGGQIKKIKNRVDAELYSAKHAKDSKKSEKNSEESSENT